MTWLDIIISTQKFINRLFLIGVPSKDLQICPCQRTVLSNLITGSGSNHSMVECLGVYAVGIMILFQQSEQQFKFKYLLVLTHYQFGTQPIDPILLGGKL